MYKVFCFFMSAVLALMSFLNITPKPSAGTEVLTVKSSRMTLENEFDLSFKEQKVNTAEIYFKNTGTAEISIYDGENRIYHRKGTEDYRFCAFPAVTADSLHFEIKGAKAQKIILSYKTSNDPDFRITSYVVASNVQNKNNVVPEFFEVITDIILFGCVTFDENGVLHTDTKMLETALSNLKEGIGSRKVNIYINILGPDADGGETWEDQMDNKAKKHSKAFKNAELVSDIEALAEKYDFDGVFFDYEYPMKMKYWNDFRKFLKKLDLGEDRKIGIAVADWNLDVAGNINKCVDMVELMQYDMFNEYGEHASFSTCVTGYESVKENLTDLKKVDMGIPFYGRPADGSGRWPVYSDFAPGLEYFDGADTYDGYSYFNGAQTVYDKTAYTLSVGMGGMMVWHYTCDYRDFSSQYSLFGQMKKCLDDRNIV